MLRAFILAALFATTAYAENYPNYYGPVATGGSSSGLSGSISSTQVAFGSATNTITGSSSLTYVTASGLLNVTSVSATNIGLNGFSGSRCAIFGSGGVLSQSSDFQCVGGSSHNSKMGLNVTVPAYAFDMSGTLNVAGNISASAGIKIGSPTTPLACSADTAGNTYYNSATKCLNYCDGTAYRQVTSAAGSCT